ncbi:hypothetical protein BDV26DRAFT_276657 [Aspergillus bertholletiae]|uniref:Protein kinase domain-containing protein n=1 Tax=Aspergillus bertholletiae TaxID=1226010 RepID=A0A5N7AMS9_9EURO|nr:hypothetical protein BDV26DRAFT_276657 [Aspergillus bertholletiae]
MKRLLSTHNENLVNLIGVFLQQQLAYLVYSYHPFAIDLGVACATPDVRFCETDIATICRSVLKGLHYIHANLYISHGDIILKNILLSEDGSVRIANVGRSLLQNDGLRHKRTDIENVGLMVIHLKEPATILEDRRLHLFNPQNISDSGKHFVEETRSAPCHVLLKHEYLSLATPDGESWSLTPIYYDAVRYSPCTPRKIREHEVKI